jgi:hypothetical protein
LIKFTHYFLHTRERPDRKRIRDEWIVEAVRNPIREVVQSDGRIRRWAWVEEEHKHLRIVLLPDLETVHNAFFDRDFNE